MGYFSNGTEGLLYQEQYCFRCVHYGPKEGPGCPIWGAHLFYAYSLCNDTPGKSPGKAMLDMLIPMEGIENLQCRLFYPAAEAGAFRT